LKEALNAEGAIAKFQEADTLASVGGIDLGIDLSAEITETIRYIATSLVQKGEATQRDAIGSDSDDIRQTAYVSATALFSQALALQPPVDVPVYVWIEPGEFLMGSTDEVDGFWIMRTEVTNEQYKRCVDAGACDQPENERWHREEYAREPVTDVDWHQANTYAAWVGGRLPTEAEWEKACRGTDGRIYPWGNEEPSAELLNYFKSGLNGVTLVGSYPPGAHGLHDMAGNVLEWTADWYDSEYYAKSPPSNPRGPESGEVRTLRGGSWYVSDYFVRCAVRVRYPPDLRDDFVGIRVASPGP
jgi:formylglycine-generating enzyme required for sulfatase activity